MAGGKETPRQKMIGMMYLVLTALLALNVSKEIVNAFVKLDQKLMESNALIINQSDEILAEFENAMVIKKNKPAIKPFYDKALKVREMVYEIDRYINIDCKNELIKAVEETDWVTEDKKNNRFKTRNPMEIETKDDYDAATRLFGGEQGTEGFAKGAEIREKIHRFRDQLIVYITSETIEGKKYGFDPSKIKEGDSAEIASSLEKELKRSVYNKDHDKVRAIYKILTLPENLKDNEETVPWQLGMFDHAPVVAASAMFTSISNDIRNAEMKALEVLKSRITLEFVKVNKLEILAHARSNYMNIGDSMNLSVMMAAYDTTEIPLVKYGIDADAENESAWKEIRGQIRLDAQTTGEHKVKGVIGIKEKGILKWMPWEFNYDVGEPTGVISNSELNILYAEWDNQVEATASGFASDRISLTGDVNATRTASGYSVRPPKSLAGRVITLNVIGKNQDGTSKNLGSKKFKVRRLPNPMIIVGTANSEMTVPVSKTDLMRANNLLAAYNPNTSVLTANFTVTGYTFNISREGVPFKKVINGNDIPQNIKTMIGNLQSGSIVQFQGISVSGPNGSKFVTSCSFTIK